MASLIVLALSNALCVLLTAWVLHRAKTAQSPIPTFWAQAEAGEASEGDAIEVHHEQKGRPIL